MYHTLFLAIAMSIFIMGCASDKNNGIAKPTPFATGDFKYGRYCGAGYPAKPDYAIASYDSIDEACKLHDKCWDDFGNNDGNCNDALVKRMYFLMEYFRSETNKYASTGTTDGQEKYFHAFNCGEISAEIANAFSSLATSSKYESSSKESIDSVSKTVKTPLAVADVVISRSANFLFQGLNILGGNSARPCTLE